MSFSARSDSDDDAALPPQRPSVGAGPLITAPTTQTTPTAPGDRDYVGSSDPNDVDLVTDTEYEEYADDSSDMAGNDSNKPTPFMGDQSKTKSFLHQMTMYLVRQEEQYKAHSKTLTNREKIALFYGVTATPNNPNPSTNLLDGT